MRAATPSSPTRRLAILLSGRGSNFESIADAVAEGRIPRAEIAAVISDVAEAPGLALARRRGLPAFAVDRKETPGRAAREERILEILAGARPDLICLAGYMRLLSGAFVTRFRGRILNIHPSLLPKFPGLDAQRRTLEAGEEIAGCTVHRVEEGTDTGPIVLQKTLRVRPDDTVETLSERILELEHEAYPEAIARTLEELERQG